MMRRKQWIVTRRRDLEMPRGKRVLVTCLLQGCFAFSHVAIFTASYRSRNPGDRKRKPCHSRIFVVYRLLSWSIARGRQRLIVPIEVFLYSGPLACYYLLEGGSRRREGFIKPPSSLGTAASSRRRMQSTATINKIHGTTHRYLPPIRPPFNIYLVIHVVFGPSSAKPAHKDRICLNNTQQTTVAS